MTLISAYGPLNYAGCLAATLSSAVASYISCPKLLQVIGDDGVYPYWMVGILTKGYGAAREPLRAYAFTIVFTLIFIMIGNMSSNYFFYFLFLKILDIGRDISCVFAGIF